MAMMDRLIGIGIGIAAIAESRGHIHFYCYAAERIPRTSTRPKAPSAW
jgi:predicted TIM-barrel enzyme